VFSDDYDLPSIAEHTERMFAMGHLPNVGPTIENQPINLTDKVGRMLNELEHAHIFIAQQDDKLTVQGQEIARQNDRIARQEAQIAELTATLGALKAHLGTE
ncbi:hypothetical protein, partial [Marimonas arenosa]